MITWLVTPEFDDAVTIAGWAQSAEEAGRWCSHAEHPFPPDRVREWWTETDVDPVLLVDGADHTPVAYGELWLDVDEAELARLIVAPQRRGSGLGRDLVDRLVQRARALGLLGCYLRVVPDNLPALALYRTAGFNDVDQARTEEWNRGQPTTYVWLELGGS